MILTPCLPSKPCRVCESRIFQGVRDPALRAAKLRHQSSQWGQVAAIAIHARDLDVAYVAARRAAGFARLATAATKGGTSEASL